MNKPSVLLTGFNPFGESPVNSSEVVVRSFAARRGARPWLITHILRTEFAAAGREIAELLSVHRPDVCLCLGLHEGAECVVIERCAFNLDDATIADNAGLRPGRREIIVGGEERYRSTLPIEMIAPMLERHGIPYQFSDSAGSFVCNHVFYMAASEANRLSLPTKVGFIHLPPIVEAGGLGHGMPVARLIEAVELCLEACRGGGDNP
jgi:pyroglutamyl-peptidase